jgi:ATP-dependent protease ClpP protease subunit
MEKLYTHLPSFLDYASVSELINQIDSEKEDKEITWNGGGGLTGAGQVFMSYLRDSKFKVNSDTAGLAASMDAFLIPCFNYSKGANECDIMIHSVAGGVNSTHNHTNELLYKAWEQKIDLVKFKEITGKNLKDVMFPEDGNRIDVWLTGKQCGQEGIKLFDETYNLLDKAASVDKVDLSKLDYKLPENIKQKYGLKKEINLTNKNDMEIKDVTVDKLASGNVDVYNSMIGLGEKKNQERVKKVMKYAQYDLEKAAEIINDGRDLTLEDVEHFMEKKHNKKAVVDLENGSEEEIKVAKLTKDKPELSKEDKEKEAAFNEEIESMREDSGVSEILDKK